MTPLDRVIAELRASVRTWDRAAGTAQYLDARNTYRLLRNECQRLVDFALLVRRETRRQKCKR